MDPTAPNNNNNPKDPNAPKNPIQPGQFVAVGEDEDGVFKQPPTPAPNIPQEVQAAPPPPQTEVTTPPPPPQPAPAPGLNIAPQQAAPEQTSQFANQPSPTPYVPPTATGQTPASPPSTIGKLRTVLIVLGFLLLVGLIAAIVWFFVLGRSKNGSGAKTSAQEETSVEAPSPPPARKTGGFSELPPASGSAQESTPSGQ